MDAYEVIEEIGNGSFGKINKVKRKSDGKVLARKEIFYGRMNEKEKLQLVNEVNILRELRHPNIVRYYERLVDKEACTIAIIMEFCEGGDLAKVIAKCRRERKYLDEESVWRVFAQIVLALHECHNFKHGVILHRDMKPENIFFDSAFSVKLGDFGLSRLLERNKDHAKTFVGTPYYMPPEQISCAGYNIKSDVWSLGCLLYEMCSLRQSALKRREEDVDRKAKELALESKRLEDQARLIEKREEELLSAERGLQETILAALEAERSRKCHEEDSEELLFDEIPETPLVRCKGVSFEKHAPAAPSLGPLADLTNLLKRSLRLGPPYLPSALHSHAHPRTWLN